MSTESASGAWRRGAGSGLDRLLLLLIDGYRLILSPVLGGHCRFVPSCSVYAQEAISRHGARRGLALSLRRLMRCQPFHRGGIDPVP